MSDAEMSVKSVSKNWLKEKYGKAKIKNSERYKKMLTERIYVCEINIQGDWKSKILETIMLSLTDIDEYVQGDLLKWKQLIGQKNDTVHYKKVINEKIQWNKILITFCTKSVEIKYNLKCLIYSKSKHY